MTEQAPRLSEDDETSGHQFSGLSDRDIKEDVQPVVHDDEDDDTSGHQFTGFSDRDIKEDVQPVIHDDEKE